MGRKRYSVNDAREFLESFRKVKDLNNVDYIKLAKSLKVFAERDESIHFRDLVDKYVRLAEDYKRGVFEKDFRNRTQVDEKTYDILKFLCKGADASYFKSIFGGIREHGGEEGKLELMFKKNYSIMEDISDLSESK